jgi:hypothetical protein
MEWASVFLVGRITIIYRRHLEVCINNKARDETGQLGLWSTSVPIGERIPFK